MSFEDLVIKDFKKAAKKLEEALNLKKTEIVRDSAIKRFELCFDLAWKTVKFYAKKKGEECYSPRDCFRSAFQLKLIDYQEDWLKMIDDRNKSAHLYKEKWAKEIYSKLPRYLELFKQLITNLKQN